MRVVRGGGDLKEFGSGVGCGSLRILGEFGIDPGCIGVCGYPSFGVLTMDANETSDW
jgi:hypothetical protein